MADQTHGAVDSLLSLLSTAIKDEVHLLGGIQGDMQFIKDEMDSMNGFLMHMTKMKMEHNDQHRAWMKQVRDIAYIAEDCVALYLRDLSPPDRGLWALVRHFLWTMPKRHRLANKFRELKVRVGEVGERRLRYGVTVPEDKDKQPKRSKPAGQDDKDIDQKRKGFLCALGLEDVQETTPAPHEPFNNAIKLLLKHTASQYYAETTIRSVVKKCMPDVHTSKMFLCALHAYPYGTKEELETLENLKDGAADVRNEVMIFCYSKLSTHYKSCLQYLTAFNKETSISRTSLVRRWVAEGLVAKEEENQTLEEAAEHYFSELVFRGFVRPFGTGSAGKVKSCTIDNSVWSFVLDMSKSENFVANLPTHLDHQLRIRDIVMRRRQGLQQKPRGGDRSNALRSVCGLRAPTGHLQEQDSGGDLAAEGNDPMDDLVVLLKGLPEFYRLNVMDLGGCRGLKKRHLKSICKVLWLKYLSLRNTDVSHLPKQINKLKLLETLDIRQTEVQASGTEHIFLPNLKHLLAGRIRCPAGDVFKQSLTTVRMPTNIDRMTNIEILSHVQVSHGDVKLKEVGRLLRLRKLGVVLQGTEKNAKHLMGAINKLSDRLRSLSIWINNGETLNMNKDEKKKHLTSLESLNISGLGGIGLLDWVLRLQKLTLCETKLEIHYLQILGNLDGLRCLRLRHGSFIEPTLTFEGAKFQNLEFLLIEDDEITGIAFEHGAAPKLGKVVWWRFTSMDITSDTISGMDHLPMLKVVELKGHCNCRLHPLQQAIAALPTEGPAADAARYINVTATVEESKVVSASV